MFLKLASQLPLMPGDLTNFANKEIYVSQLKSSQTPSWNRTFTLPRSFYTDKTFLAFQFNDALLQWEPSEFVSGTMLTVGELLSGPQERTFQLKDGSQKLGKATFKWNLVEKL